MTQQMTDKQLAQQNNRTRDGKYTTKAHSEAEGITLHNPGISQWVSEVGRYHQSIVENANWPTELTQTHTIPGDDGSEYIQTDFRLRPGDDENKVVMYMRHYHERYGAKAKDARLATSVALHVEGEDAQLIGGFDDSPGDQDAYRARVNETLDALRDAMRSDRQDVAQQRYQLNDHIAKGRDSLDASQRVADLLEIHDLYGELRSLGVHKFELARHEGPHYEILRVDADHENPDILEMEEAIIEPGIPWQALRRADVSGNALMGRVVLDVTQDPGGLSRAELEDQMRAINARRGPVEHSMDDQQLYTLNDQLTASLADMGWTADSEEDYDRLNDLTHDIAGLLERHRRGL